MWLNTRVLTMSFDWIIALTANELWYRLATCRASMLGFEVLMQNAPPLIKTWLFSRSAVLSTAKPHNEVPLSDFTVKSTSCGKEPAVKVEISVSSSKTEFIFDQYFSDTCSQSELFESCGRPVVDEVLEGFNGSVFAYGQTGIDKFETLTMR